MTRVLFVSKPIAPPWHDGSKNLVRDIATHLRHARPTVLVTEDAQPLGPSVELDAVYASPGRFASGLVSHARVARRLLRGDPLDLWHFVFAPNARSSAVARACIASRRLAGWAGRVVQTIASAPRDFRLVRPLLFGDEIVALGDYTRGRLLGAGVTRPITVIPPCAADPGPVSSARKDALRRKHALPTGPLVVYPGDYEVSTGAATTLHAALEICAAEPDVTCVLACRAKTARSHEVRAALEAEAGAAGVSPRVRHLGEIDDMPALLASARVVVFPVDDLYGKVDVPLVLLEAMALGVPLVVARGGSLEALTHAALVEPDDAPALAAETLALLRDAPRAAASAARGRSLYDARFSPQGVADLHDALYARLCGAS